jgi:hypothetical protein
VTRPGPATMAAALGVAFGLAPARVHADDAYLAHLAQTVRARLTEIAIAKAPKLVPPVPVAVRWKVAKVGTIELGAPLVALVAGELDGDPRAGELYAVTSNEVIAIGFRQGRLVVRGRVAFTGERAVPAVRDPVGTAVIEGGELVAATSAWAGELRVAWTGTGASKTLVARPGGPGFLVCPGERAQLVPGRNYFATGAYAVRCRNDLVDRKGYPLRVRADLSTANKLAVVVQRCGVGGVACEETARVEYSKIGVAFEIADVDRDGTPELIVSGASAPGERDSVKVIALGGDERKALFAAPFAGGVAGIAAVDGDDPDDVAEVVVAVRFPSSTRVDFWRLD